MQENYVHKVGLVIISRDAGHPRVLLAKAKPGQWSFPDAALPVALERCDKDHAEPLRAKLNLGKAPFVSTVFYRDSKEDGTTTRFFAIKCGSPENTLEEASRALDCQMRWASFEEASWIVAANQLEVAQWAERLLNQKTEDV